MQRETILVDISEQPELLAIARQVNGTGKQVVLLTDGEELARVFPARGSTPRQRGRRTFADDPFWNIVGMFASGERTAASEHVDEVLAAWEAERNRP